MPSRNLRETLEFYGLDSRCGAPGPRSTATSSSGSGRW